MPNKTHTDIYRLLHRKPKRRKDTGLGDIEFESEPPIKEDTDE